MSLARGEGARGRGEQKRRQRAARVRDVRRKGGDVQRAQSYRRGPLSTVSILTVCPSDRRTTVHSEYTDCMSLRQENHCPQ